MTVHTYSGTMRHRVTQDLVALVQQDNQTQNLTFAATISASGMALMVAMLS